MRITIEWKMNGVDCNRTISKNTAVILGRRANCDIVIPDTGPYKTVSRQHAKIFSQKGRFCLQNLSKKNPIHINKQRLSQGEEVYLKTGDTFRLGAVEINVAEIKDGSRLKLKCPNCGFIASSTATYCYECGQALAGAESIYD